MQSRTLEHPAAAGGLVGGFGARAVSRKTPSYFMTDMMWRDDLIFVTKHKMFLLDSRPSIAQRGRCHLFCIQIKI